MTAGYFIRSKGRVTGPFEVGALHKMVRRGLISRLHELSSDRQSWSPAGEFEELFPQQARGTVAESSNSSRDDGGAGDGGAGPIPIAPTPASSGFYYSQEDGGTVGPVPLNVLRALVLNGTVRQTDAVWQEGAGAASVAAALPQLRDLFGGVGGANGGYAGGEAAASGYHGARNGRAVAGNGTTAARVLKRTSDIAAAVGVAAGAVMLLALNLPVDVSDKQVAWWWDGIEKGSGWMTLFCFYFLFAGIALCAVGPLVRGIARAVVFVSIAGLGFAFLSVAALGSDSPGHAFVAVLATFGVPALAAALAAASRARSATSAVVGFPGGTGARASLVIFGASLVASTLTVIVSMLAESDGMSRAPAWVAAAFALSLLASLAALVAGGIALGGGTAGFGRGLNVAVAVLAGSSIALLAVGVIVACAGLSSLYSEGRDLLSIGDLTTGPSTGLFFFLLIRLALMFGCLVAVLGAGMLEMLVAPTVSGTAAQRRPAHTPGNLAAASALGAVEY